jgi:predicted phage terminase large subunit-like protein
MATSTDHLIRHLKLQDAVLKRHAEQSLYSYVQQAWPILEPDVPFVSNWHIEYVIEHLEAVTAGQITRLLINLPPRYMKSLLVSVLWPTWEWIRYPERRWIFASYAESLAIKHSVDRRTIFQSPWFLDHWRHRVTLAADQNEKREFRNTRRGHMIATSPGGSILGKGGNRIVFDDPHNPVQAESETQREAAVTFYTRTLSTRLDNKQRDAIVVVMQRLHESDLAARCLDLGVFTHVCLPAEAEVSTRLVFPQSGRVYQREVGDVLWPARESATVLAQQRQLLGSVAYAGQYQQRPAPAGGAVFRREWFQYYDELPQGLSRAQSWDMAFKDAADNDYVVGLVAGHRGADIYLIDLVKGHWSFTDSCKQVERLCQKYPRARPILIEDAANGTAIVDALKQKIAGIVAVRPEGGKLARAHAAQPRVEAGNVYLPNPRPHGVLVAERAWVDDFLHQLTVFPNGTHDDDVDAFTQLLVRWQRPTVSCVW